MNRQKICIFSLLTMFCINSCYNYKSFVDIKENNKKIQTLEDKNSNNKILINKLQKEIINKNNEIQKTNIKLNNTENELEEAKKLIHNMNKKVSFNPYDITVKSNATVYHMKKALKNTTMKSLAPFFVKGEKLYGINAIFLAGIVANESDWNRSPLARNQNNLSGYCMYDRYSRGSTFSSKEECILQTALLLKRDYVDKKGKYYNGKTIWDVNKMYCQIDNKPCYRWSKDINSIAYSFMNKANK